MNIGKEEIICINQNFKGSLRNDSSLDYSLEVQKSKKIGKYKKLAYLIRAILVDHPFSDGNKRTATYLILEFARQLNKSIANDLLESQIISIAKNNVTDIRNLERRLKNVIR